MGDFNDIYVTNEVVESKDISEISEQSSELDSEITNDYEKYMENDKSQEFVYKTETFNDVEEISEKKGGSYKDIKENMSARGETGEQYEVHHTPANSCTELDLNDGPAIKMEKEDHRETASCGMSKEAQEYRAQQKELIDNGKFDEAIQMDVDDLHDKFGVKYDEGISEMREYSKNIN